MADILRWYMGEVESVAALVDTWREGIDVTDNASALFRFKNGATGVLELSWTLPPGAGFLEIYGSEGAIRSGFGKDSIELLQKVDEKTVTTPVDVPTEAKDSFQCFADAIRGEAQSPTPGEYGRRALALCEAVTRSGASGKFVKVKSFIWID